MTTQIDPAAMNWASIRLKRIDGLVSHPRRGRGGWEYFLEHPDHAEYFWIGQKEYTFLSLLDGSVSIEQAAIQASHALNIDAFSEGEIWRICVWFHEQGLVTRFKKAQSDSSTAFTKSQKKSRTTFSPFWTQIPIGSLDPIARSLLPFMGPLYSFPAISIGMTFVLVVFLGDILNPTDAGTPREIFWAQHWIWLGAAWLGAKLLHEISHAVVCRKYGGQVGTFSLALVLLVPLAAVDVSSAWRFRSKWQRLHVSLAGIYSDLVLAAILLCLAGVTRSPVVIRFCYDFSWLVAVGTVLFNANPLMRYDGYYVLTDLINIPNLYEKGMLRVRDLILRATSTPAPTASSRDAGESRIVLIYGVLAAVWRLVITLGLCFAAVTMFRELGVLMAIFGLTSWYVRPARTLVHEWVSAGRWNLLRTVRTGVIGSLLVCGLLYVMSIFPCPWNITAPALVDFPEEAAIRIGSTGFIRTMHVDVGESVERGTLLVELQNEDLVAECAAFRLSIDKSHLEERIALSSGDTATVQIEQEKRQALEEKLRYASARCDRLRVSAPTSGQVVAAAWSQLIGTYAEEGQEMCVVSNSRQKRLILSVAQSDAEWFAPGTSVRCRIGENSPFTATIARLAPRASVIPQNAAFCAPLGGPVPAVPRSEADAWDFLEPRFAATVVLPESIAEQVVVGQRAQVYTMAQQSLWEALRDATNHRLLDIRRRLAN